MNPFRAVLLVCLFTSLTALAGPTAEQEAALKDYHRACVAQIGSSDVLPMCDTLAGRARQAGSGHYIVMAAEVRLDYYYFRNNKDQILKCVDEVKRLSREYDEPESYYFAWGSRLIFFYLKNGMSNHALLEAQNMLREARSEDCQKGMIECYKAMGNIYTIQSNSPLAAEYYRRMIDLVEKYDPEDVNLPIYYSSLSESEMRSDHLDEAEKALEKIEAYFSGADTVTPYQRLSIERSRIKLCIKRKDRVGAQKSYERIEGLFARYKDLSIHSTALYEARLGYYMYSKEYGKAIAIIDSLAGASPTSEMKTFLLSKKGDICWLMDDRAEAAECYRDYITLTDSVRQASVQQSANEIAGLLDLQQLEREKQQLQVDIQQRRLRTTYWALALLGAALIVGTVTVIRLFRLNRRLKVAERLTQRQNTELELAREKAEAASDMKSRFIQDISHEVRTPLNAIVGFSAVVSELCDQPETREYSSIIAANSDHLLRLFNDVLELSNLDQLDELPYDTVAGVDASCLAAVDQIRPFVKESVELTFRSPEENLPVRTNPIYVTRVLDCLLHNAAKFTESGVIVLECAVSRSEGVIRYAVSDTGPGIPVEMQELVFERFRKLDSFTQGSGLGLTVCRAIAVKLGGTLEIDRDYVPGCRFLLTLPLLFPGQ